MKKSTGFVKAKSPRQHYHHDGSGDGNTGTSANTHHRYHDSADDRNQETFGELDDSNLMKEFDFSKNPRLPLDSERSFTTKTLPPSNIIKQVYTLDEIENFIEPESIITDSSPLMTINDPITMSELEQDEFSSSLKAMTLEELESSFKNNLFEDAENIRLPALKPQKRTLISGSMISFPERNDAYNLSFMSLPEQKLVRKLHKCQLMTDDPIKEDFYYLKFNANFKSFSHHHPRPQSHSNFNSEKFLDNENQSIDMDNLADIASNLKHSQGNNINFLPLKKPRSTTVTEQKIGNDDSSHSSPLNATTTITSISTSTTSNATNTLHSDNIWKGVLGRISSKSTKKPRQQLAVPSSTINNPISSSGNNNSNGNNEGTRMTSRSNLVNRTKLSAYTLHMRVLEIIENYLLDSLLLINDKEKKDSIVIDTDALFGKSEDPEVALYCFLHILTIKKGLICLYKLIPLIDNKEGIGIENKSKNGNGNGIETGNIKEKNKLICKILANIEYIIKELNDDILGLFVKLLQELIIDNENGILDQSFNIFFMEKELSMLLWILSTKVKFILTIKILFLGWSFDCMCHS